MTDPPYAATGTASSYVTRDKVRGIPREYQFYEAWLRELLVEFVRVLKPTGAIFLTLDWRGAMALDRATARFPLSEPKVGVWHRKGLGMGHVLRNVYECFAVVTCADWERRLTAEPDVWEIPWSPGNRQHGHSAEKPVELFRRALRLLAAPGAVVLDPFAGSGTSGLAALEEGMSAILVEREPDFAEVARARVAAAHECVRLARTAPGST